MKPKPKPRKPAPRTIAVRRWAAVRDDGKMVGSITICPFPTFEGYTYRRCTVVIPLPRGRGKR